MAPDIIECWKASA